MQNKPFIWKSALLELKLNSDRVNLDGLEKSWYHDTRHRAIRLNGGIVASTPKERWVKLTVYMGTHQH